MWRINALLSNLKQGAYFACMKTKLLFTLLLVPFLAFTQIKDTAYDHTYALYDSGHFETALQRINQLIEKDNSRGDYFDLRGMIKASIGKMDEAAQDFSTAISKSPKEALYYHHRANAFYSMQSPDQAIEDNNSAIEYASTDSLKYSFILNRGSAKTMKRDFKGAYEDFMEVLKYDSTNQGALTNLGATMDDLGRSDEAIMYLEKVVRLYPDFVGGYGNLAFRYADMGEYKKALELDNKVIAMDPKDPLGYNNRGYVKYKLNDLKGAMADISKSLSIYPANSYAYRNRALVYIAQKQISKACDDLSTAIRYGFTEMYGNEVKELQSKYCK
ncbi:MAG TPA: tetratricopeptide repeat protein [Flavisolibacter sp.]|nr:tetratricopeptide repeat protein [Flavisolibacter sp.]